MRKAILILLLAASARAAPSIRDVTPSTSTLGAAIFLTGGTPHTIAGTGFGAAQGNGAVILTTGPWVDSSMTRSTQSTITAWSNTSITFTDDVTGLAHGDHRFLSVVDNSLAVSTGIPVYIQTATPTITSVTGSLVNQTTITINGSNFGTRTDNNASANYLVWLYLDHSAGDLTTTPYKSLSQLSGAQLAVSSATPRHLLNNGWYQGSKVSNTQDYINAGSVGTGKTDYHFYCHYRSSVSFSGAGSQQVKGPLQYGPGDVNHYYWMPISINGAMYYAEDGDSDPFVACEDRYNTVAQSGTVWHTWEQYFKTSTDSGARDGRSFVKIDGKLVFDYWKNFNVDNPNPCSSQSNMGGDFSNSVALSGSFLLMPGYQNGWSASSSFDTDEEFYDLTMASVLVSTFSTYAAMTNYEVIPAVSWSNTQITALLNPGVIGNSPAHLYVYVIDKYGVVNANGFDAAADITGPVITNESAGTPGQTSATVTATTDELSTCKVNYGLTSSYTDFTVPEFSAVTSHSLNLTSLTAGTGYHYQFYCTDTSANVTPGDDKTFTTAASAAQTFIGKNMTMKNLTAK